MGYIIWKGKSQLDQDNIVCIATNKSNNIKTGDMIQIWILVDKINPIEASQTGLDKSVCGNCIHRGNADGTKAHNRSCYVSLLTGGPQAVWRAYKNGKYKSPFNLNFVKNKLVRFGAFGDPLAVPFEVWEPIFKVCKGWTGYTHQWQQTKVIEAPKYFMASVDSIQQYEQAKTLGYRTFRVMLINNKLPTEIICPASKEQNFRLTCEQCMACDGVGVSGNVNRRDIAIIGHGGNAVMTNLIKNLGT